jgi:lipopolysaccharide transport system permease protein
MTEHLTILEAGRAEKNYWRDLWRYRELFFILAWRDVSVRYKQTVIGVAWGVTALFLWWGIALFRRMEKSFADLI